MLRLIKKLILVAKHLRSFYLPVYILREQPETENAGLIIAYAGYSSIKRAYFGQLLFKGKPYSCALAGRYLFWRIHGALKRLKLKDEIVVAETSFFSMRFFMGKKGFIVPEWLDMYINVSEPMAQMKNRAGSDISNAERLIRKNRLMHEISREKSSFEIFYHSMYLPYVKSRYNETAIIMSPGEFKALSKTSSVLLIKNEDDFIAGVLMERDRAGFYIKILGIKDGNWEYVQSGAIGAIYYFSILEARKRGDSKLRIGATKPFLNDGLTRFKIGMTGQFDLKFDWERDYLWIGPGSNPEKPDILLEHRPFVYLGKDFKFHHNF